MSLVLMSEKGQVTIPQEIRRKLHISKGDSLNVEMTPEGRIVLNPVAVLPLELYSEARLREFAKEDELTESEKQLLKKKKNG